MRKPVGISVKVALVIAIAAGGMSVCIWGQTDPLQPKMPANAVAALQAALPLPPDQAVGALQTVVRQWPTYYNAQYNLGLSLLKLQRYQEALSAFRAAQPIGDGEHINNAALLNSIGWTCYLLGDYTQSQQNYEQALGSAPSQDSALSEKILNNLGTLHLATGDIAGAKQYFTMSSQRFQSDFAQQNLAAIANIEKRLAAPP